MPSIPLSHGAPWQPGLGTLGYLPPEIRDMIWVFYLDYALPIDHSVADRNSDAIPITELMLIYASKQLHQIITEIYYRGSRNLTICLGHPEHDLVKERYDGRYTNYHIDFNGVIRSRDLAYTDFAFFESIKLTLKIPVKGPISREPRFNTLKYLVLEFSELIQDWQSRSPWWSIPRCPRIEVVVDIPFVKEIIVSFKLDLENLADLLKPLGDIDNCDDATIQVLHRLRCGQEWVPEIVGQITMNMKSEGKDFKWLGANTADALMLSSHETLQVGKRVAGLKKSQRMRRLAADKEMDGDDEEERREKREEEERKGREEEEELQVLLVGRLPCGPPASQPDAELLDRIERSEATSILNRILATVILLDLLVLDWLWVRS
ncbi:MAG: hypothetical protein Q9168_005566 [Polycauliona sp. 1 TL-2023]